MTSKESKLNYGNYLQLDTLLSLQKPRSTPEQHDELLFITIHQVYELWFKLLLHELDKVKRDLSTNDLFGAIHTFKRARTIMKTLVGQLDVLETMTPRSFTSFRDRLERASGFQSMQFRELEFLLGFKRSETLAFYPKDLPGLAAAHARLHEPSLVHHFYQFLRHRDAVVPQHLLDRDVTLPTEPNEELQDTLLTLLTSVPELEILFELMMDFDEGLQEWRYRHVKIVERTIGRKTGTGGSPGVEFLKKTLFVPVFPDLWAVRKHL